jgi:hypothetical protein
VHEIIELADPIAKSDGTSTRQDMDMGFLEVVPFASY